MAIVCAVTGANGYIGSECVRYFQKCVYTVIKFVRNILDNESKPYDLSINIDPNSLSGVDILIHCAYEFKLFTWEDIHRVNVEGSRRLFHAAHEAGIKRIVYISSVSAYVGCQSLYGKAKLEIEEKAQEMDAFIIRPGLVFGSVKGGMFNALYKMTNLPLLPVFSGGRQPMALIHMNDLVALIQKMAVEETGNRPKYVVAAHPEFISFRDILLGIAHHRNKPLYLVSIPGGLTVFMLKLCEKIGLSLGFRSDSLISLLHSNEHSDFENMQEWHVALNGFSDWAAQR